MVLGPELDFRCLSFINLKVGNIKCQVSETIEADIIEVETDSSVIKDFKEMKLKHEQQELSPETTDQNDEEETLVKIRMSNFLSLIFGIQALKIIENDPQYNMH